MSYVLVVRAAAAASVVLAASVVSASQIDPTLSVAGPLPVRGGALAGAAAGSNGVSVVEATPQVVYQNTSTTNLFTASASPRTSGADDVTFVAPQVKLTSVEFGYVVGGAAGAPAVTAFDARVRIWDNYTGTDQTNTSAPAFGGLLSEFTVSFAGITDGGAATTGPISLTGLPGGGVDVNDPQFQDAYVEIAFLVPSTTTLIPNNAVTYLFDGTAAEVGEAFDIYWRDANGSGSIEDNEARSFGGAAGSLSNFYLAFNGEVVPEPTSLSLLGLAGLALVRRRR